MFSILYDKMLYAWCYLQSIMLMETAKMEDTLKELRKDQENARHHQ